MEIGISAAVALRATVSITNRNTAPRLMLAGTIFWLLLPKSIRQIWGIKSPTQPTCAHMETQDAVIIVAASATMTRITRIFTPIVFASSSLSINTLSFHRRTKMIAIPTAINGAPSARLLKLVFARLPISQ